MRRHHRHHRRHEAQRRLVIVLCALVMLASALYILRYEQTRRKILRDNAEFSALYDAPEITDAPAPSIAATAIAAPKRSAPFAPSPTAAATATASPSPAPSPTAAAATALPSPAPSPTAAATATASPSTGPSSTVAPDSTPVPTANADTLVVTIETPPPVQDSFDNLLQANPETVGFLRIEDVIDLPVVQRPGDNEFYLRHGFDGEESIGGTLFLDGANLLVPEDDCLIVYGHNMRNGTMFHMLSAYEKPSYLKQHALVRFDTLYESRIYAPFAALSVSADPNDERYLNLREFSFDEPGFDLFVRSLRTLSAWDSPLEVEYGDRILLLVTCEYTHDDGRFVVALRAERDDESWDQLLAQVQDSK